MSQQCFVMSRVLSMFVLPWLFSKDIGFFCIRSPGLKANGFLQIDLDAGYLDVRFSRKT